MSHTGFPNRGMNIPTRLPGPPPWLTRVLLHGHVVSRLVHFGACFTSRSHDMRAFLRSIGSLILIFMAARVRIAALGA